MSIYVYVVTLILESTNVLCNWVRNIVCNLQRDMINNYLIVVTSLLFLLIGNSGKSDFYKASLGQAWDSAQIRVSAQIFSPALQGRSP